MTKALWVLILLAVLFVGYQLATYYQEDRTAQEEKEKKELAARNIDVNSLGGMPWELTDSYAAAVRQGPEKIKQWMKANLHRVDEPRRSGIEIDYCRRVFRDNPKEAREIFHEVQARTPPKSPLVPLLKQLEPTFK